MVLMMILPAWAMLWNMFNSGSGWWHHEKTLLFWTGAAILGIQIWMVVEGFLLLPKVKGILEEGLPPLPVKVAKATTEPVSGPNC